MSGPRAHEAVSQRSNQQYNYGPPPVEKSLTEKSKHRAGRTRIYAAAKIPQKEAGVFSSSFAPHLPPVQDNTICAEVLGMEGEILRNHAR